MRTTFIATSSADDAETPLSVDKYKRFSNDQRSDCMSEVRPKIAILTHTGSPMKVLKTAVPRRKASLVTVSQADTLSLESSSVSAIEREEVISKNESKGGNRFV